MFFSCEWDGFLVCVVHTLWLKKIHKIGAYHRQPTITLTGIFLAQHAVSVFVQHQYKLGSRLRSSRHSRSPNPLRNAISGSIALRIDQILHHLQQRDRVQIRPHENKDTRTGDIILDFDMCMDPLGDEVAIKLHCYHDCYSSQCPLGSGWDRPFVGTHIEQTQLCGTELVSHLLTDEVTRRCGMECITTARVNEQDELDERDTSVIVSKILFPL